MIDETHQFARKSNAAEASICARRLTKRPDFVPDDNAVEDDADWAG
jgi:hypothetical protein